MFTARPAPLGGTHNIADAIAAIIALAYGTHMHVVRSNQSALSTSKRAYDPRTLATDDGCADYHFNNAINAIFHHF